MVKLHFKDTSEFEGIFKRKNMKVTDAIVLGIKFYHEYEKQDEETSNKQIDTWKLLEAARVW